MEILKHACLQIKQNDQRSDQRQQQKVYKPERLKNNRSTELQDIQKRNSKTPSNQEYISVQRQILCIYTTESANDLNFFNLIWICHFQMQITTQERRNAILR